MNISELTKLISERWELFVGIASALTLFVTFFKNWAYLSQKLTPIWEGLTFKKGKPGEILILMTPFLDGKGVVINSVPHQEIGNKINTLIEEMDIANVRINYTIRKIESRKEAEKLGKKYKANLVIWGKETGVRVETRFLNITGEIAFISELFGKDFGGVKTEMEGSATNPNSYSNFVTRHLPEQFSLLALYVVANSQYYQNQLKQAENILNKLIKRFEVQRASDRNLEGLHGVYNLMASVHYHQGDLNQAIADLNQALEINPKDTFAYNNRGNIWRDKGNLNQAISDYSRALDLKIERPVTYNSRGLIWMNKNNLNRAITDFNHAIELNPEFATAYNNRGIAWAQKGDLDKALSDCNRAIDLNRDYVMAFVNRGNIWQDKGNLEKALADYKRALELDPKHASAYWNRAIIWRQIGELEKAKTDEKKFEELTLSN